MASDCVRGYAANIQDELLPTSLYDTAGRYELWVDFCDNPEPQLSAGSWVVLRDNEGREAEGWIGRANRRREG